MALQTSSFPFPTRLGLSNETLHVVTSPRDRKSVSCVGRVPLGRLSFTSPFTSYARVCAERVRTDEITTSRGNRLGLGLVFGLWFPRQLPSTTVGGPVTCPIPSHPHKTFSIDLDLILNNNRKQDIRLVENVSERLVWWEEEYLTSDDFHRYFWVTDSNVWPLRSQCCYSVRVEWTRYNGTKFSTLMSSHKFCIL